MAQHLKRKRAQEDAPRKVPKFQPEENLDREEHDEFEQQASEEEGSEELGLEEEEEWTGVGAPDGGAREPESTASHSGTKPKKPPTGEEVRIIKDAAELFKSSSFKLQVDALLPNVRPKSSRMAPLDRFLLSLHPLLMGLPSIAPQHPLEAARRLQRKKISVPYPLPLPLEETNWKVAFEPPSDITLVGSWANKISVKSKDGRRFGVDLAVEMPDSLFQEKDYLNGRFFHKKAFYLATIAAALSSSKNKLDVDVVYDSLDGDPRLTRLVLIPRNTSEATKLHAQIVIIPTISSTCPIPLHRLSPSHSNLRVIASNEEADKTEDHASTPHYNAALVLATTPKAHLLATHSLKQDSPAFADALTLLRIWANQRGYGTGSKPAPHRFQATGPFWATVLGLLIHGEAYEPSSKAMRRKPLGRGLSSYQLFRAALDFAAKHDFRSHSLAMRSNRELKYPIEEYKALVPAALLDSTSIVNVLDGVPLGSLEMLQIDAQKTLEVLDQNLESNDPFVEAFLKERRDVISRFDTVLRVDLSSTSLRHPPLKSTLDYGSPTNATLASIDRILHEGLGNRTKVVAILHPPPNTRPLSQAHPDSPGTILIGLVHDPEQALRLVDNGPAADETDETLIATFRQLWGEKAELRRFKDGRILESVVWEVKTVDERAHIPGLIVRHLLKRHFGIGEESVDAWQTSFDSVLRLPESVGAIHMSSGTEIGAKSAIMAFDRIIKSIKALDDELPLALLNVSAVSEALRYTSVFSPVSLPTSLAPLLPPNARYLAPIEFILEFEKSSKWPDDLRAIQKIKLAFFERVATQLMASTEGVKVSVVVGDGTTTSEIVDQSFLEIVTPEGWAFSARIWHDREATLLDRILDGTHNKIPGVYVPPSEIKKGKEYFEALEAKEVYTRRFIHAPRHHRAVTTLCHRYGAYAGTVRLVKRWLASHWLLAGHVSEEVVEILCAQFFVGDGRFLGEETRDDRATIPGSKERGFATVVRWLAEWKWEEGTFVPMYGPGTVEDEKGKFKPAVNSGVWKVSTEMDKDGHVWTSCGPDGPAARRVSMLAKATWEHMQGLELGVSDVKSLFIHPTDDYDFVILLDPMVLSRYAHNIAPDVGLLATHGKYANLPISKENSASLRVGFDPARAFCEDLRRIYHDTMKVFWDPFGGDRIGCVWDPALKKPRPFRVLGHFSAMPCAPEPIVKGKDNVAVVLNESAVLAEIQRMGGDLVKEISHPRV